MAWDGAAAAAAELEAVACSDEVRKPRRSGSGPLICRSIEFESKSDPFRSDWIVEPDALAELTDGFCWLPPGFRKFDTRLIICGLLPRLDARLASAPMSKAGAAAESSAKARMRFECE